MPLRKHTQTRAQIPTLTPPAQPNKKTGTDHGTVGRGVVGLAPAAAGLVRGRLRARRPAAAHRYDVHTYARRGELASWGIGIESIEVNALVDRPTDCYRFLAYVFTNPGPLLSPGGGGGGIHKPIASVRARSQLPLLPHAAAAGADGVHTPAAAAAAPLVLRYVG